MRFPWQNLAPWWGWRGVSYKPCTWHVAEGALICSILAAVQPRLFSWDSGCRLSLSFPIVNEHPTVPANVPLTTVQKVLFGTFYIYFFLFVENSFKSEQNQDSVSLALADRMSASLSWDLNSLELPGRTVSVSNSLGCAALRVGPWGIF